ncbi:MAG: TIGR03032 family protein [Planctomycetaceae bacterium]|nr:TIGR03032 family protein [Planctomycetaceae bacterium]
MAEQSTTPVPQPAPGTEAGKPWLNAMASRYFTDWLTEQRMSLAFTTYQTGKVFFVGCKADRSLSLFERTFKHCMGMWAAPDAQSIWLSSRYQLWRLERSTTQAIPHQAPDPEKPDSAIPAWVNRGYDFAYIPRVGYTTGHLDVHDMAVDKNGRLVFVNTLFGCLATISDNANFVPLWKPPFLSALVPEDRCHLNGLAMKDGMPAYVTAVSESDVNDGWRDRRRDGGCVIDVQQNEVVARGLSMPHSPRWYHEQLWVHNSGTGEFGKIDLSTGKFEPVAFCPGYLRGLSFQGDYAIATLSKPRHVSFHGLELDDRLEQKQAEARCGLQVIDLNTGAIAHSLRLDGSLVTELYDVVTLPGTRQPMAVGFQNNEIERLMIIGEEGTL